MFDVARRGGNARLGKTLLELSRKILLSLLCLDNPMQIDLTAGSRYTAFANPVAESMARRPTVLVFDSGLGGLTVFAEILRARPDAALVYAADDAAFPYGRWSEPELVARVGDVMDRLVDHYAPDAVVVACNTASTLVLPHLRARFPSVPFVGTVPAIKPAAARSRSRRVSVLATPGTVARDYTRALIQSYAADCDVTLVGSSTLAGRAEASMQGETVADAALLAEIAPCFVAGNDGRRTDCIALACTHYPLLLGRFEALAPWPVAWIDPAPAIARRVDQVLTQESLGRPEGDFARSGARAVFTSGTRPTPVLARALAARGIASFDRLVVPVFA